MTRDDYAAYRNSTHWRAFSSAMRDEVGACEECGITDTLNVHHKHYRSLGCERREDVLVLCERCHHNEHILQDRMKTARVDYVDGQTFQQRRDNVMKILDKVRSMGGFIK